MGWVMIVVAGADGCVFGVRSWPVLSGATVLVWAATAFACSRGLVELESANPTISISDWSPNLCPASSSPIAVRGVEAKAQSCLHGPTPGGVMFARPRRRFPARGSCYKVSG